MVLKRGSKGNLVKEVQKVLHLIPDGIFGIVTEEAVKNFQEYNGLKADGIVGYATLAKMLPSKFKKSNRIINELIIHCSATPAGKDYTVDDIRRWHKQQGWSDVGYHYIVYRDGTIVKGRDVDVIGAHCNKGGHNTNSIGICYIGGVGRDGKTPKDTRTNAQKEALMSLLIDLKKIYPKAIICGHKDYDDGKACPSFNAKLEYIEIV